MSALTRYSCTNNPFGAVEKVVFPSFGEELPSADTARLDGLRDWVARGG